MIRTTLGRTLLLTAAVLGTGAVVANCSKSSLHQSDEIGSVTVALTLSPGVIVNTVTYAITGNGISPVNGSIDVTNSQNATALVSGIPAGTNYTVTMDATSTNGLTTCHGVGTFNVVAGQTAMANVILQCRGPGAGNTGTVAINGRLDNCPFIASFSASSLEATVGSSITIGVTATDYDATDVITYVWSASPTGFGTIAAAGSANTTFTCTAVGSTSLSIAVSDGVCGDSKSPAIPVRCLPGTGNGSGGATGTGGANTGSGGANTGAGGAIASTGGATGSGGATGTGGAPAACIEPVSGNAAQCCTCTTGNCSLDPAPNGTDGCSGLATASAQALCRAAAACFGAPTHGTAGPCTVSGDANRCFCGNSAAACFATAGAANGPCTAQVIAAAGTSDPAMIRALFTSPASPLGRAVNLLGCQGSFCSAECSIQ